VQPGIRSKLGLVLASAATHAALLASYGAFRPVREALILEHNPDSIPWMFLATFIAISVVSPVWSALLARRSPRRYVGRAFHAFALCLVGFVIALYAGASRGEVGRVFYVWSAVFNLFAVSVFWSLMADLLGPSTARQLYGPIAAGGSLGAIAGPLLTQALVETIRPEGVLVMSAVLLELAAVGVWLVRRTAAASRGPAEAAADTEAETAPLPGGGALTGVAHVARSPYLSAIVGYVLCTACGATFMYLAQQRIVYDAHLEIGARTRYLASIDQWTQTVTFVLQLVIAGPAIRWLGPGLVLAVLPLARGIGLTVLGATSSLAALRVVQVIGNSATHGLTRPARELLFTVVSRDDKYRAKNAIDTIGYRFGDLASSWLNKGLAAIGGLALAIAPLPLAAVWLALAAIAGIGFRRRAAAHPESAEKLPVALAGDGPSRRAAQRAESAAQELP
jgi:ATP:ADP antiporter, AAA family